MSEAKNTNQTDVWEKWSWAWDVIFYTTILASCAILLSGKNEVARPWLPFALAAGLILWHWLGIRYVVQNKIAWDETPQARFVIILIDIFLWFALVLLSPAFYLALFGLFAQVYRQLPLRYAVVGTLILTGAIIAEQVIDSGEPLALSNPSVWLFLLIGLGGILLGAWISAIIAQSSQRRALIEQLEQTQRELVAAERREGILQERQRLSGEIHDTLAQGFTSIVMLLQSIEHRLPSDADENISKNLGLAAATARSSLEQARRLVWELRPEPLEGSSLSDALQRICAQFQERSGLQTDYLTTGQSASLHPEIEIALLRALQEGLHNVEKHARATSVNVTLSFIGRVVMLDITDDGMGFDQSAAKDGHYGLLTMQARAEKLKGKIMIESEANEGTTVVIEIPIEEVV